MKFSIIVPVYNVEKYIEKCLESIKKQKYKNFEVIIVNDGSKQNESEIIKKYLKDSRFKYYEKKNGGLSDARNYGVKYAKGDYLIFIDSDDYIELNYLNEIYKVLTDNKNIDVLKFKYQKVDEQGNLISIENSIGESRVVDFKDLIKLDILEPAWSYVYKTSFWIENKFKYMKGKIHEDFGLTPEVLMRANKIYYFDSVLYNYVQREGSIMSSNSNEKIIKSVYDVLEQYDRLIKIKYDSPYEKLYASYLSYAIINKARILEKKDLDDYLIELEKRHIHEKILDNNLFRKIKKNIIKHNIKLYLKIFK